MKKSLTIVTLAILSTTVFAQSNSFKAGFYGGVEVGTARVDNNTQTLTNELVSEVGGHASATQDRNIGVGRLFAGYKFTENIDLEVGYFQTNEAKLNFSGVTRNSNSYSGVFKLSSNGVDYSALLRPNISTGLNDAFLRVGGHSSREKVELTGSSLINSQTIKQSGTGMLFGAGYDLKIANNTNVRFQINRLLKVAGDSDEKSTVLSIGVLGRF